MTIDPPLHSNQPLQAPKGALLLIGDSHIGLTPGSETPISNWLERAREAEPKAIYLNGDVFHYLIAHPKFQTSAIDRVMDRFRETRDAGTAIHYVEGNRDFFLHGSFVENAVSDIATEYTIVAGNRKYLVIHGDMINERDWPYRFWRFASKNALSKFSLRFIPRGIARGFVDGVEQRLSKTNFKHKKELPMRLIVDYAKKRSREGYTDVVFGHFHEKVVVEAGSATVTILPPWYETGEAMVIDPVTGESSFAVI